METVHPVEVSMTGEIRCISRLLGASWSPFGMDSHRICEPSPIQQRSRTMIQTTHQRYDIQRGREVRPCDGGMQVDFDSGLSACLRKGHPDYERALHQARSSLQHGYPVGLLV